ncbi:uncharacterized protein LOC111294753 [Durio zibethinus]|uniref:Uncharacterized protein LOC111294753 n=1 Tax=Durio zibethinus TaxID=66656 RepID=A0A6P5YUS3_DURZI|nr:uncharacterized protein LOC111294753 [Durio zibethinus]
MERQSSSSLRRQNSITCMSAIFNLLSRNHKRSKFLTSGKKQRKQSATVAHEQRLKAVTLPRSPTIPAELRRSKSVDEKPPHALVARLMGIDKFPPTPESTAGERVKLLGELEKCYEELKALQRVIEVVKTSVSVGNNNERLGRTLQQQKKQLHKKKPGDEDFFDRFTKSNNHQDNNAVSALWRSEAMVHSVDEVCKDIAWGERREIGRIGLALQHHICGDLIDEIVREIGCYSTYSLPFQACRRGLSF